MKRILAFRKTTLDNNKINITILIIIIILYVYRAIIIAYSTWVGMDEGYYLIKGYWFLTGELKPFQVNGAITNKPPLAFLIPGISQLVYPGILSGRIFSILISVGALIGLWLTIKRLSNPIWGNIALLIVTCNYFWIETFTREYSQNISNLFFIWSLYFGLGKVRTRRQLIASGLFAILMVFVRHNMLPYIMFLFIYFIWEHGAVKSFFSFVPAAVSFVFINFIYWPGIYFDIWRGSLPVFIRPFMDSILRLQSFSSEKFTAVLQERYTSWQIIQALSSTLKTSFIPLGVIFLSTIFLIDFIKSNKKNHKSFVFLVINFNLLLIIHLFTVIQIQSLLFNMDVYLLFWELSALLLLPEIFQIMIKAQNKVKSGISLAAFILLMSGGIFLSKYNKIAQGLLNLRIPRVKNFSIQPGTVELWRVITNKFEIEAATQKYLLPTLLGLIFGVFTTIIIYSISKQFYRKSNMNIIKTTLSVFLMLSILISWLPFLSSNQVKPNCKANTIISIRNAGKIISSQIESGSLIFWGIHNQPAIGSIFYFGPVRIFPEQLNGEIYYRQELTLAESQQSKFWSAAQAKIWLQNADYLIAEPGKEAYWLDMIQSIPEIKAVKLKGAPPMNRCNVRSEILLYRLDKIYN